jgi:hypothetical protein
MTAGGAQDMAEELDDAFYERADAHIHLSNDQLDGASRDMVNASMLFAAARFSAWVSASGHASGAAMEQNREQTIDYFMTGFRQMLEANLDAYIKNFDAYMKPGSE